MGKQEKARYKKISDRRDRKYSHEKHRIKHPLTKKGYTCGSIRSLKNKKNRFKRYPRHTPKQQTQKPTE